MKKRVSAPEENRKMLENYADTLSQILNYSKVSLYCKIDML